MPSWILISNKKKKAGSSKNRKNTKKDKKKKHAENFEGVIKAKITIYKNLFFK